MTKGLLSKLRDWSGVIDCASAGVGFRSIPIRLRAVESRSAGIGRSIQGQGSQKASEVEQEVRLAGATLGEGRSLCEEAELWVDRRDFGAPGGLLAEGSGEGDLAAEAFEIPAVSDEVGREPVQQSGMAGGGAEQTEVVSGGDQSLAKKVSPEAIDEEAGGEGMIDDCLREIAAGG